MEANTDRKRQEMQWAPWQVVAAVATASAALFTAGATVGALLVHFFGH